MLCPKNANKEFDDLNCRDCECFMQCFKMWQDNNIWGNDKPTGDNFPLCNCDNCNNSDDNKSNYSSTYNFSKVKNNINPITIEEINKFKMELGEIIFYSDWEKKSKE
jgi:hypothetical protein